MNSTARTLIELDRNNAGTAFIGGCDFDENQMGVRAYVLSSAGPGVCDRVMHRRFQDMIRLMGDNVLSEITDSFRNGLDGTLTGLVM